MQIKPFQQIGIQTRRYALLGIAFGFIFPVIATMVRVITVQLPLTLSSIAEIQRADPLLWIVDTAPFFLGLFAALAGWRQDVLEETNNELHKREDELRMVHSELEQRVAERTHELTLRTQELETLSGEVQSRARKLRAVAEVARSIASVQNIDQLLPAIATVVSQEFGFYHVGIFLNDDANDYAILRASNSEGGRRMLARGHRLKIGQVGMVGNASATGRARIALDTGEDAVFFNNPDLPETRSEIALPLRARTNIIGVLDVQSEEANAFGQGDVELLTVLADQISTAIQNARLFAETQRALSESESVTRQYVRQQWSDIVSQDQVAGAKYTGYDVVEINETAKEILFDTTNTRGLLSIPIKLRSEIVGVINIRADNKSEWDEDEIDILEATAERVAIALENARLLQDAQRRASKERIIGDISTKLSSSVNIENIVRTALLELGQVIPGTEITLEFEQADGENAPAIKRD